MRQTSSLCAAVLLLATEAAASTAAWPNLCVNDSSVPAYSQTRCNAGATCCPAPFSVTGKGCCPWPNAVCCPNNKFMCCPSGTKCVATSKGQQPYLTTMMCEPLDGTKSLNTVVGKAVCKPGPYLPFSTTKANVVVIGDSLSIGYTPVIAGMLKDEALVQHSPYDTYDGGAEETAYGLQCLEYFTHAPSGAVINPDVVMFNWGMHDGPLGNSTHPGQQGNSSVYKPQLQQIATQLKATFPRAKLLFALTTAYVCSEVSQGNTVQLNNWAKEVMGSLDIPTVDLNTPILDKCGPIPNAECMGQKNCFCPHCPGRGYEWLASTVIAPAVRALLPSQQ